MIPTQPVEPVGLVPNKHNQSEIEQRQRLSYHRWFMGMECRKDILTENDIMNRKIRQAMTPRIEKIKSQVKDNKMRLAYFFGFCFFFSLDKVYNYFVLQNTYWKQMDKKISELGKSVPGTIREQQQGRAASRELQKQKIFLQLDQQVNLTKQTLKRISGRDYGHEHIDMISFIQFFQAESEQSLKSQILGQYPRIHLD